MSVCVFKTKDLKRCITHALNSSNWQMGYDDTLTPAPGLFFVHDSGVYLMSNGNPGDVLKEDVGVYVAYADGCNPNIGEFDDWYNASRELVGGDDFAEILVIKPGWEKACDTHEEFHVQVTPESLSTRFYKPKGAVTV